MSEYTAKTRAYVIFIDFMESNFYKITLVMVNIKVFIIESF